MRFHSYCGRFCFKIFVYPQSRTGYISCLPKKYVGMKAWRLHLLSSSLWFVVWSEVGFGLSRSHNCSPGGSLCLEIDLAFCHASVLWPSHSCSRVCNILLVLCLGHVSGRQRKLWKETMKPWLQRLPIQGLELLSFLNSCFFTSTLVFANPKLRDTFGTIIPKMKRFCKPHFLILQNHHCLTSSG